MSFAAGPEFREIEMGHDAVFRHRLRPHLLERRRHGLGSRRGPYRITLVKRQREPALMPERLQRGRQWTEGGTGLEGVARFCGPMQLQKRQGTGKMPMPGSQRIRGGRTLLEQGQRLL